MTAARPIIELEFSDEDAPLLVDVETPPRSAQLARLLAWWTSLSPDGTPRIWQDRFITDIDFATDILHIHGVVDGSEELMVRFMGRELVRVIGFDATGLKYSPSNISIPALASQAQRVFEMVQLARQMDAPVRTYSKGPRKIGNGSYTLEALYLPFGTAGNKVGVVLGATVYTPASPARAGAPS